MIDITFTSVLQKVDSKGGWTYATWPDASEVFGTHGAVKVRGTIDGHQFETSFMAMGDGVQMLPVKTDIRTAIGKQVGDTVTIHLTERLR